MIENRESVNRLEYLITSYDQNIKIIDFLITTESFYDLELTQKNIMKIVKLLADSSRTVIIIFLKLLFQKNSWRVYTR
jgi:hypothetical protein